MPLHPKHHLYVNIIKEFVAQNNRLPSSLEYKKDPTFPRWEKFRTVFGSFTKAIIAAGFEHMIKAPGIDKYKCAHCDAEFELSGKQMRWRRAYVKDNPNALPFCSKSCATTHQNLLNGPKPDLVKQKIRNTINSSDRVLKSIEKRQERTLPHSRVYTCTCGHCKCTFVHRSQVKYCAQHSNLYKSGNRNRYAFTFSLSEYPDLFGKYSDDLRLYGMWSYSNTNGLTRDHKVSVNEAIRNNYDPYYIKHPLNCELIPWADNNRKKTSSSITFDQLKQLVDEYDNKCAVVVGIEPT